MTREVDVYMPLGREPRRVWPRLDRTSRSEVRGQYQLGAPRVRREPQIGNPSPPPPPPCLRRSAPCPPAAGLVAADIAGRPHGAPKSNADCVLPGPSSKAVPRGHHTQGELTILIGAW